MATVISNFFEPVAGSSCYHCY